jgi:hypothetical protein
MNEIKTSKEEQDEFNKKFLTRLIIFMFFYRFYSMHIDQEGVLVNCVEKCFNEISEINEQYPILEDHEIIVDDLD